MTRIFWIFLTLAACLAMPSGRAVRAQDAAEPVLDFNPWTGFGIGSWKKVRTVHESLNDAGKVQSVTINETKTTLVEVAETHYTLMVETTVDVGGKRFEVVPKNVRQGYHGEAVGQTVEVKRVGPGEIVVDGRKYPAEIQQVTVNGGESKRVTLMHINENTTPPVLRRETTATDAAGQAKSYESVVEVVAVDLPVRVLNDLMTVSYVKTVHRDVGGGSTIVMETHSASVPGAVVAHSAKELNAQGRMVSREALEMTEYHVVPIESEPAATTASGRRRLFRGNRPRSG